MNQMLIIDRFEGDFAVCEETGGEMRDIPRDKIRGKAAEGDVLYQKDGWYEVDHVATKARRKEIQDLTRGFWAE